MRFRSTVTLAAGLSLACTAGAETGLEIKVAFPRSFHTQAIPTDTRAVPVLVFHDGKLLDRAILTPHSPGAFFRGLPAGDVEVVAAGFSRRFTPVAVGKGDALIQPASLAKAEVVMRETSSDPLLDRFKPFLDEIRRHIEREFPEASASPAASASPDATRSPIPLPSADASTAPTAAPSVDSGGASVVAPTVGAITGQPSTPYNTSEGNAVPAGPQSLASGDLLINGVNVGAIAFAGTGLANARALADQINLVSASSGVKAYATAAATLILYSKGIAIDVTANTNGQGVTGLSNADDAAAVAANYYSGYPVYLSAPVSGGSPLSYALQVINGGRTATYAYDGSQWLLTDPGVTASPLPVLSGSDLFNSPLQEGDFGQPILSGGMLRVVWRAPIVGADTAMSVSLTASNSAGSDSSPAWGVTLKAPTTVGGNASVGF